MTGGVGGGGERFRWDNLSPNQNYPQGNRPTGDKGNLPPPNPFSPPIEGKAISPKPPITAGRSKWRARRARPTSKARHLDMPAP